MSCVANLRQEQAIQKAMTFNEEMSQTEEKSDPQSSPVRGVFLDCKNSRMLSAG